MIFLCFHFNKQVNINIYNIIEYNIKKNQSRISSLFLLRALFFCLFLFAFDVVFGEVAILAHALRVVRFVGVSARVCHLAFTFPVIAIMTHILSIMFPIDVRASCDKSTFAVDVLAHWIINIISLQPFLSEWRGAYGWVCRSSGNYIIPRSLIFSRCFGLLYLINKLFELVMVRLKRIYICFILSFFCLVCFMLCLGHTFVHYIWLIIILTIVFGFELLRIIFDIELCLA